MRKWLYHDDKEAFIIEFKEKSELDSYYADGWRDCFRSEKKEEVEEEKPEKKDISQMTDREHLVMLAKSVGLKIDKRWGDDRLMDEIEQAQNEQIKD